MTIPKQEEFEVSILEELSKTPGGQLSPQQVYATMAKRFPQITAGEWHQTVPSGARLIWNRIQWARQRLVEKGEVDKSTRGVWRITQQGLARIRHPISSMPAPPTLQPRVQPAPPSVAVVTKRRHEELIQKIEGVRDALGYQIGNTHGATYDHDCTFAKGSLQTPFLAWEVCDGGNLDKDVASLQWAADSNNWRCRGILVVTDPKDVARAKARLTTADIRVVTADFVDKLHEAISISSGADVLKGMFP